jgi:hypothetical protein
VALAAAGFTILGWGTAVAGLTGGATTLGAETGAEATGAVSGAVCGTSLASGTEPGSADIAAGGWLAMLGGAATPRPSW